MIHAEKWRKMDVEEILKSIDIGIRVLKDKIEEELEIHYRNGEQLDIELTIIGILEELLSIEKGLVTYRLEDFSSL